MKTTSSVHHPLLCSFILAALLFGPSLCSGTAEKPAAVVDIAGNYVRAGAEYYILPVIRGRGGGLTLAPSGSKRRCPLNVAQEQQEVENGLPLTLTPVDPKKGVVRVSTDHNIKFSASTTCVQSTVWALEQDESSSGRYLIATGGVEGNPGAKTLSNWFKIEEYEGDYKLVFCPTVCNFCKVICKDVRVFVADDRSRLLGFNLTDDGAVPPFRVVFKKAIIDDSFNSIYAK